MQIRKHKGRIQLLRSEYDKSKKRSTQRLVGSFPSFYLGVPDQLSVGRSKGDTAPTAEVLTPEEIEQLTDYMKGLQEAEERSEQRRAISYGPMHLPRIAQALDAEEAPDAKDLEKIEAGLQQLRKSLTKAKKRAAKAAKEGADAA